MNRARPVIAGIVVATVIALVAMVTTGTMHRLISGEAQPTADVADPEPADPTDAGPDTSAATPPAVEATGAADAAAPDKSGGDPPVFDAAAVSLTDDDGGTAMFTLSNAAPGSGDAGCITVTYTGDSAAGVRLYGTTGGTGLDNYLDLTITRGAFPAGPGPFDPCTGFVADTSDYIGAGAGVVYAGTLAAYPDDFSTGIADPPGTPEAWTDAETRAYRFAVTVVDDNAAQGLSASQAFTWEARGEAPPAPVVPVPVVDPTSGPPGTVVTVGSGSDPCVPPSGAADPRARVWIADPETGAVLTEVSLPVAADGSWSGTITVPESGAAFSAVDLHAACSATTAETAAAAATTVYRQYAPVPFAVVTTPSTPATPAGPPTPSTPSTPADAASPVPASPTFVG